MSTAATQPAPSHTPAPLVPVPLTNVTVNITGGLLVLTSATGDYDIDQTHGVIHANVFPPANPQNGGPNNNNTYVLRGTAGGNPVAFVGLIYVGQTAGGTYKFSYNMGQLENPAPASLGGHAARPRTPFARGRAEGRRERPNL